MVINHWRHFLTWGNLLYRNKYSSTKLYNTRHRKSKKQRTTRSHLLKFITMTRTTSLLNIHAQHCTALIYPAKRNSFLLHNHTERFRLRQCCLHDAGEDGLKMWFLSLRLDHRTLGVSGVCRLAGKGSSRNSSPCLATVMRQKTLLRSSLPACKASETLWLWWSEPQYQAQPLFSLSKEWSWGFLFDYKGEQGRCDADLWSSLSLYSVPMSLACLRGLSMFWVSLSHLRCPLRLQAPGITVLLGGWQPTPFQSLQFPSRHSCPCPLTVTPQSSYRHFSMRGGQNGTAQGSSLCWCSDPHRKNTGTL